jgi:aldose 1-epimerase
LYRIYESELAGNKTIVISHIETGNETSVIVDYGGAINTFVVDGKHILRASVTPEDFEKNTVKAFAGVQLFPFPNRVKNARYFFSGNEYRLPQNDDALFPHSLHGLVYNKPFEIASVNETEGKVVLTHHFKADAKAYPFDFLLSIEYQLNVNSLQVKTGIHNLSNLAAPVGYGWHPYIALSGKIDDCSLQLPATKFYVNDDTLIPNGKTDELKKFTSLTRVGDTELNHCFELPDGENEHPTILEDANGTRIQIDQQGYSFIQYYIPPDRKSIAIEPQTCIANALNNKIGLIMLPPGEELGLSFKISILNNISS